MLYELGKRLYYFDLCWLILVSIYVSMANPYTTLPSPLNIVFDPALVYSNLVIGVTSAIGSTIIGRVLSARTGFITIAGMSETGYTMYAKLFFTTGLLVTLVNTIQQILVFNLILKYIPYLQGAVSFIVALSKLSIAYYILANAGILPRD